MNSNILTVLSNMHNYTRMHKNYEEHKDQANSPSYDAILKIWMENTSKNIWNLLSITESNAIL